MNVGKKWLEKFSGGVHVVVARVEIFGLKAVWRDFSRLFFCPFLSGLYERGIKRDGMSVENCKWGLKK